MFDTIAPEMSGFGRVALSNLWLFGPVVQRQLEGAASTNATLVKSSAGTIGSVTGSNTNAAVRYLKVYNKATAPTVGTDTPLRTIMLPPNGTVHLDFPKGLRTSLGIGIGMTTGAAVADTGAVAAAEVISGMEYI